MKKIGKIAAPFASLIPGVGPLIGAGLGLLGGIGGGSKGGSKGGMDPQFMSLLGKADTRAGQTFDAGMPLVNSGAGDLNTSGDFYKAILQGGDKYNLAMRGPMFDITKGYEQAQKNTAAFAPRGSSASAFADNAQSKARDLARLRSDSMMGAAGGLAGVGSSLLGGGTSLVSGGNAATGNVLSALLGGQSLRLQQAQLSAQKWGGLGQGIGSLLGTLLMPGGVLNGGKTGGTSSSIKGKGTIGSIGHG